MIVLIYKNRGTQMKVKKSYKSLLKSGIVFVLMGLIELCFVPFVNPLNRFTNVILPILYLLAGLFNIFVAFRLKKKISNEAAQGNKIQ